MVYLPQRRFQKINWKELLGQGQKLNGVEKRKLAYLVNYGGDTSD